MKIYKIIIDKKCVDAYNTFYFLTHPKAKVKRIKKPQHPSLNEYMYMNTYKKNNEKQCWSEFMGWIVEEHGLKDAFIKEASLKYTTYFEANRKHDLDNITPKFILDGLKNVGFIEDDDSNHIHPLIIDCGYDKENPRIELEFELYEEEEK